MLNPVLEGWKSQQRTSTTDWIDFFLLIKQKNDNHKWLLFIFFVENIEEAFELWPSYWCFSFTNLSLHDDAKDSTWLKQKMLKMNKDLTTSSKDALLLLNIYILRVQSLDPRNIELAINLWPSYWCITKAYYLYWNTKIIGVKNNSMWAIINGQGWYKWTLMVMGWYAFGTLQVILVKSPDIPLQNVWPSTRSIFASFSWFFFPFNDGVPPIFVNLICSTINLLCWYELDSKIFLLSFGGLRDHLKIPKQRILQLQ